MSQVLSPIGFWSYARQDDEEKLSRLRSVLQRQLQQKFGREEVRIFQDVAAIPPGADWEKKIREAVSNSTFFIPIVTPNFLESPWCNEEFLTFLEREKELAERFPALAQERRVFPIGYIDVTDVESYDPRVLVELRKLQFLNFMDLVHRSENHEDVHSRLDTLSDSLRVLLRRDRASAHTGNSDSLPASPISTLPTSSSTAMRYKADLPLTETRNVPPQNLHKQALGLKDKGTPSRWLLPSGIAAAILLVTLGSFWVFSSRANVHPDFVIDSATQDVDFTAWKPPLDKQPLSSLVTYVWTLNIRRLHDGVVFTRFATTDSPFGLDCQILSSNASCSEVPPGEEGPNRRTYRISLDPSAFPLNSSVVLKYQLTYKSAFFFNNVSDTVCTGCDVAFNSRYPVSLYDLHVHFPSAFTWRKVIIVNNGDPTDQLNCPQVSESAFNFERKNLPAPTVLVFDIFKAATPLRDCSVNGATEESSPEQKVTR